MATFEITEGAPGQGKSLYTAKKTEEILHRNKKWFKITGIKRRIGSNLKFSAEFESRAEGYLFYWTDPDELTKMRDVDIIWDEIATELDARNWINLSVELKRFLSQYRKRGLDIYANTQDFSMIDARARLMISKVQSLTKIVGSRDISTTKPNPKFLWGVIMCRGVTNFKETDPEKKKYEFIPSFFLIEKHLVSLYDTTQDIPAGKPARLKHTEVFCEYHDSADPLHTCNFRQVRHS